KDRSPRGRHTMIATIEAPNSSMRNCANSRPNSGKVTRMVAASTTPSWLPIPPRTTIAITVADSWKLKLSGLTKDWCAPKNAPANPASIAPIAKAGFAGAFFGAHQSFVSPESFNFQESATVIAIVVLGGMGSQLGVVLAAIILVTLPEFGREFAQFRMLLFGASMVAIMVWRPRGLLSLRTPSIRLPASPRETAAP